MSTTPSPSVRYPPPSSEFLHTPTYSAPTQVEEILARTRAEKLMKIYNLPAFNTVLEFLTMLALSTGRLLRVPSPFLFFLQTKHSPSQGGTPDILAAARQVLVDWNNHKIPFFSEPPVLHAAHVPSTMPGAPQLVAPGAETTGNAQFVSALGAPFVLDGLFGEADAQMDAPEEEEDGMMDVEDDRLNSPRKRAHSPSDDQHDPAAFRAPKRLRRLVVRSASLPTAAIAIRSRRAERVARRKRERAAALKASAVGAGMEVDGR